MKAFFEISRDNVDEIFIQAKASNDFPRHFHSAIEVLIVTRGAYAVTLGDKAHTIRDGALIVFDSFDVHGYDGVIAEETTDEDACIVIIPYKYLGEFNAVRGSCRIASPIIANPGLCAELTALAKRYFSEDVNASPSTKKAAASLFLSLIYENLTFTEAGAVDDGSLIRSILTYIHKNYRTDISLSKTARALGFTEAYISRTFHRYVNKSFSSYVNTLRLDHLNDLRARGDTRKTTELLYEAGFQSQQTYYRWAKK